MNAEAAGYAIEALADNLVSLAEKAADVDPDIEGLRSYCHHKAAGNGDGLSVWGIVEHAERMFHRLSGEVAMEILGILDRHAWLTSAALPEIGSYLSSYGERVTHKRSQMPSYDQIGAANEKKRSPCGA